MESLEIKIARDFSFSPGPRYIDEGKNSGEQFRKHVLYPKFKEAIKTNIKIVVDLDGTDGYGTSFLEEAFGGLIRIDKLSYEEIIKCLKIISKEENYLIDDVFEYLKDAHEESAK